MTRVLIAGVPRAGKTTLATHFARDLSVSPLHTDDVMGLGWSQSSLAVAGWIENAGPWVIEGVSIPRALRKWLDANQGAPADIIYWMPFNKIALNPGQSAMAKGCATVWFEILPALIARGVSPVQI